MWRAVAVTGSPAVAFAVPSPSTDTVTITSEAHLEHLGPFARTVATGIDAPPHAWVKEFVRAYLGPQYATRSLIRACAERLLEPEDALFGMTLELAHTGRDLLEPSDVRVLLDRTPVLPGPAVPLDDIQLWRLRPAILRHYDRATLKRIFDSIVHSVAQETARELEIDQHTTASFRYLLDVRAEYNVEEIVDRLAHPLPTRLAEPLFELVPRLDTGDPRDAIFAAAALRAPAVSCHLTDQVVLTTLWRAWELGIDQGPVAVLTAATNPELGARFPDDLFGFVTRGLRTRDLTVRAAAVRSLAAPHLRANRGATCENVLQAALGHRSWRIVEAALNVVAGEGLTVLGRHGRLQFLKRLDAWAASPDADDHAYALDALERMPIREAVGPLTTSRILEALVLSDIRRTSRRAAQVRAEFAKGPSYVRPSPATETEWTAHRQGAETLAHIVTTTLRPRGAAPHLPNADAVTTWRDLDPHFDDPIALPPEADALDGLSIAEFRIRVLRTPRELIANAKNQRNCTNLWVPKLQAGRHILVAVHDEHGRTVCNADWVRKGESWRVGQVLAKCNDPRVDPDLRNALTRLGELLDQRAVARAEPLSR